MKFSAKQINCDFCEIGITETKLITKTFKRFGQSFTIENIEAEVCNNCGEAYLSSDTIKAIDNKIEKQLLVAA
jgi:YgiT-type zinc finger domain-containing protein